MHKRRVLITDGVHPVLIERLEEAGFNIDYHIHYTSSDVKEVIHIYEGIVINSKISFDKDLIDCATNLKFIARLGSGMEIIDTAYAKSKGIACYNSPQGNCDSVAEHAIAMLLGLFNKLNAADNSVRQGEWDRETYRGEELLGKTVSLLGYGNTGKAMAKKLSGFGVKVLAYDKYLTDYGDNFVEASEMTRIFAETDVLSIHLPLTEETGDLVNSGFIRKFTKPIYLINTSRGPIVNTADLIREINNNGIKGACLDVFENEKPQTYSDEERKMYQLLWGLDEVILSPHVAGWTFASKFKLANILADLILAHHHKN